MYPATAEIDTLSLHAALPISLACDWSEGLPGPLRPHGIPQPKLLSLNGAIDAPPTAPAPDEELRSEEHTSELQSHSDLVCRLLLEKKKVTTASRVTTLYTREC